MTCSKAEMKAEPCDSFRRHAPMSGSYNSFAPCEKKTESYKQDDLPVTYEEFSSALVREFENVRGAKLSDEENKNIKSTALYVMNFFGYSDYAVDNMLTCNDRKSFYFLEELGLLKTEIENVTLHGGRDWLVCYWVLDRARIRGLTNNKANSVKSQANQNSDTYYSDLYSQSELWQRAAAAEAASTA